MRIQLLGVSFGWLLAFGCLCHSSLVGHGAQPAENHSFHLAQTFSVLAIKGALLAALDAIDRRTVLFL